jgi:DNA repair protein RadC
MPEPNVLNLLTATATGERPQERLERLGASALKDIELLALLLRSGTRGQDVLTLATRVLAEAKSIPGMLEWKEPEFRRWKGVGRVKAVQLVAMLEFAKRAGRKLEGESPILNQAVRIVGAIADAAEGLQVEKFWVLCLNRRNRLLKQVEVSSGTATATLAHPREVFRPAIREAAAAVVCAHNHPSGDPSPSAADIQLTRQLREAAAAVDIPLLDHVIIGRRGADPLGRGYYSFREAGLL